jgi:phage gpG-like protein
MATGVNIEFSKRAQEILEAPGGLTPRVQNAIQRAMNAAMEEVAGKIVDKRLSFPKGGKTTLEGLRVDSSRLRRSMMRGGPANASKAAAWDGLACVGSIGTNVRYAAVHEFGGTFTRRSRTRGSSRLRSALQLSRVGGKSFSVTYPARAPVRKTVEENRAFFAAAVSHAIEEASK